MTCNDSNYVYTICGSFHATCSNPLMYFALELYRDLALGEKVNSLISTVSWKYLCHHYVAPFNFLMITIEMLWELKKNALFGIHEFICVCFWKLTSSRMNDYHNVNEGCTSSFVFADWYLDKCMITKCEKMRDTRTPSSQADMNSCVFVLANW